jgi:hypothetical protein
MSGISYGTPGDIASLPTPAATVSIASSTFATPIVVTTSGAHGLQTGQAVIVNGHEVNTAADGIWIAFVLTTTTFRLLTFAGANSVGIAIGAGTGTVQSLALPGITIPEDAVDARTAASVNVPFEGLHDMVQWLAYRVLANVAILKGGSRTLKSGAAGTVDAGATETINGNLVIDTDGVFAPTLQIKDGTVSMPDPQRKGDAAAPALTVSDGQTVLLTTAPTTARVLTLLAPSRDGLWIDFYMQASATSTPATKYYEIIRSGSADYIARLSGWTTDLATDLGTGHCRVHSEGGVWRLSGGIGILLGADA